MEKDKSQCQFFAFQNDYSLAWPFISTPLRVANAPRQDPPVSLRFAPANMRIETDVHGAQANLVSAATAHPRGISHIE